MLSVLSPLPILSKLLLSPASLRILRAYLGCCKEDQEKVKISSILASVLGNVNKEDNER